VRSLDIAASSEESAADAEALAPADDDRHAEASRAAGAGLRALGDDAPDEA